MLHIYGCRQCKTKNSQEELDTNFKVTMLVKVTPKLVLTNKTYEIRRQILLCCLKIGSKTIN